MIFTTLIAQAAPATLTPWLENFFWLVGGIGALLGCAVAIKMLRTGEPAPTPQPLEVKAHSAHATKSEVDQLHGRINREREELDAQMKDLREENRALRDKLDEEISALQDRIDAVPQRVITLLRETKNLI